MPRPSPFRRPFTIGTAVVVALGSLGVAACDDETAQEIDPDLNATFPEVPRDTIESPALASTVPDAGGGPAAPFGTLAIDDEVRAVEGTVDDGGDFTACSISSDRIDVAFEIDSAVFAFAVVDDVSSIALGTATAADVDYSVDGDTVRGDSDVDGLDIVFEVTC